MKELLERIRYISQLLSPLGCGDEVTKLAVYAINHPEIAEELSTDRLIHGSCMWHWEGEKPVRIDPTSISIMKSGEYIYAKS